MSRPAPQPSLFDAPAPRPVAPPPPDPVFARKQLIAVLRTLHAAEVMPWPEFETRKWERLFPQLAEALPRDEADQLFGEFRRHLDRLGTDA